MKINLLIGAFSFWAGAVVLLLLARFPNLATLPNLFLNLHHCASEIQELRINLQMHNDTLAIRSGITTSNSATQTQFCQQIGQIL